MRKPETPLALLREHYELEAGSCASDRKEGDDGCPCLVCRTRRALPSPSNPGSPEGQKGALARFADRPEPVAEFTLCAFSGRHAVGGRCPLHGGDNCLRQYGYPPLRSPEGAPAGPVAKPEAAATGRIRPRLHSFLREGHRAMEAGGANKARIESLIEETARRIYYDVVQNEGLAVRTPTPTDAPGDER